MSTNAHFMGSRLPRPVARRRRRATRWLGALLVLLLVPVFTAGFVGLVMVLIGALHHEFGFWQPIGFAQTALLVVSLIVARTFLAFKVSVTASK